MACRCGGARGGRCEMQQVPTILQCRAAAAVRVEGLGEVCCGRQTQRKSFASEAGGARVGALAAASFSQVCIVFGSRDDVCHAPLYPQKISAHGPTRLFCCARRAAFTLFFFAQRRSLRARTLSAALFFCLPCAVGAIRCFERRRGVAFDMLLKKRGVRCEADAASRQRGGAFSRSARRECRLPNARRGSDVAQMPALCDVTGAMRSSERRAGCSRCPSHYFLRYFSSLFSFCAFSLSAFILLSMFSCFSFSERVFNSEYRLLARQHFPSQREYVSSVRLQRS